ncbi:MAG: GIY-YIG nuclease family protein [Alphaproteobacteria bacterium]|nr:GIY-YIG nuclease family protein [Alphaproteobacteria bacterium]
MSDLDELREELDDFAVPEKAGGRSAREERILAGFEEIQRFHDEHRRAPRHGEDGDIFERLYAVRLDRMRELEECRALLKPLDSQGLLGDLGTIAKEPDDDELLAELRAMGANRDITELRHVRSAADKRAAEEIANRRKCEDFESFRPVFAQVQKDLKSGARVSRPFVRDAGFVKAEVKAGQFFILGGQLAYVAGIGEAFRAPNGDSDARLRVIYSNGTESDLLLRSLQRALYKDDAGRRITDPDPGPLFASEAGEDDPSSGVIYVLRSKSNAPAVAANRDILHKIGVTGKDVEKRIANARMETTYLMADVEIVATYILYNVDRAKLEKLIHRIFDSARADIGIRDRFGNPVRPREWFLVPRFVVDEAVERIRDGTITEFVYDPKAARLVKRSTTG